MTEPDAGLDLLPFLRLLRADLGVWFSLAAIVLVLGVMGWTSWGSRRALRKCLVLSIAAHVGLLMYGGGLDREGRSAKDGVPVAERIQSIRVADAAAADPQPPGTSGGKAIAGWDQPRDLPADDPPLRIAQRAVSPPEPMVRSALEAVAPPEARPPDLLAPEPARPEAVAIPEVVSNEPPSPASANEIPVVEAPAAPPAEPEAASRVRSSRPAPARDVRPSTPVVADLPSAPLPRDASPEIAAMNPMAPAPEVTSVAVAEPNPVANEAAVPDVDLRSRSRSRTTVPGRSTTGLAPVTIARGASSGSGASPIPLPSSRPISDVPEVYRDRLEPDRAARARLLGASIESERSVERALAWLARHQDADGRWNAGTKKYSDGRPAERETSHTMHCPPDDPCDGECFYFEADTAMTGLSLLAYLGAGHTHMQTDGKYASVVAKGLQFLLLSQRADGDLRGESRAVGMYCHAMASLALCEAYAMTGDARLRGPAERAVAFLFKARAADGMSWRYSPRSPSGDTSLLGWGILVMKSAESVGIDVPPSIRTGALGWLKLVSEGPNQGLAFYRPNEGPEGTEGPPYVPGQNMTPTMTAEAWACRQFLGTGAAGASSTEASQYLLTNAPDRNRVNLYYWYYGTLAMFQRGGNDWSRWNGMVRDALISLQSTGGHQDGSWSPTDSKSKYDARGGRIYCTAVAAMTLEVYYRYHRSGEDAKVPSRVAAPPPDARVRRTGTASSPR